MSKRNEIENLNHRDDSEKLRNNMYDKKNSASINRSFRPPLKMYSNNQYIPNSEFENVSDRKKNYHLENNSDRMTKYVNNKNRVLPRSILYINDQKKIDNDDDNNCENDKSSYEIKEIRKSSDVRNDELNVINKREKGKKFSKIFDKTSNDIDNNDVERSYKSVTSINRSFRPSLTFSNRNNDSTNKVIHVSDVYNQLNDPINISTKEQIYNSTDESSEMKDNNDSNRSTVSNLSFDVNRLFRPVLMISKKKTNSCNYDKKRSTPHENVPSTDEINKPVKDIINYESDRFTVRHLPIDDTVDVDAMQIDIDYNHLDREIEYITELFANMRIGSNNVNANTIKWSFRQIIEDDSGDETSSSSSSSSSSNSEDENKNRYLRNNDEIPNEFVPKKNNNNNTNNIINRNRNNLSLLNLSSFVNRSFRPSLRIYDRNVTKLDLVRENNDIISERNNDRTSVDEIFDHVKDIVLDDNETFLSNKRFFFSNNENDDISNETNNDERNNDFRKISLYPRTDDLLSYDREEFLLRPIIVRGRYADVNDYLDVHFRLLRADFVSCLNEGIRTYKNKTNTIEFVKNTLRIYRNVKFLNYYVNRSERGYLVKFPVNDENVVEDKRFMYGSLVIFTEDDFEHFFTAIVVNSDSLHKGLVGISLIDDNSNINENELFAGEYILAESTVFFEPYFSVMNALQAFRANNFPMEKYIVAANTSSCYPRYARKKFHWRLNGIRFNVYDKSSWPSADDLLLDTYQYEAFVGALTSEFAVIQGPPGTGKTFLALKLMSAMLTNLSKNLLQSPILVISNTNSALDEFLAGILNLTDDVVRVGGQSRNEIIAYYNLRRGSIRDRTSFELRTDEIISRTEVEIVAEKVGAILEIKNKIRNDYVIVSLRSLKPAMNYRQRNWFEKDVDFLNWLIDDNSDVSRITKRGVVKKTDIVSFAYDRNETLSYIDRLRNNLNERQSRWNLDRCRTTIDRIENIAKSVDVLLDRYVLNAVQDVTNYSDEDYYDRPDLIPAPVRWRLYNVWSRRVCGKLIEYADEFENIYPKVIGEYDRVKCEIDVNVLKNARVIGLTTSGAARNKNLLTSVNPKIVFVEEAAQILESHVVASLTNSCEHVILVGDHKQLKPSIGNHTFGKKYNLDLSLFERMINNGIPCHRLNRQHRMRPEIATLVSDNIYFGLENDVSVYKYRNVRGMKHNMFFITHDYLENKRTTCDTSFCNMHEASFTIELCRYLILQNYSPEDITILTMYTGQLNLITKMKKQYAMLENILMCTLDSYQGKENNIVLLSLVRSNQTGSIGFLSIENRICVALSRAKIGFYIIGNMNNLAEKSTLWRKIEHTLKQQEAIGNRLSLVCQVHGTETAVETSEDIRFVSSGGCSHTCGALLKEKCFPVEIKNQPYRNRGQCLKFCQFGHKCEQKCGTRFVSQCESKFCAALHCLQCRKEKLDAFTEKFSSVFMDCDDLMQ